MIFFYCRGWLLFLRGRCSILRPNACGGKIACLFWIACGGKKSIACGGKWVSLMTGYIKPIACGSKHLRTYLTLRWWNLFGSHSSVSVLSPHADAALRVVFYPCLHIHWKHRNADVHKVYVNFFLLYRISLFLLMSADDEVAMTMCAQEHERDYPTPTTGNWSWKSSACVCRTARKMMRLPCLCVHRNMNVIIPPHPTVRLLPLLWR